ncbi:immunogenic protein MPT63, partial [Mycolicibacterium mageritense DSM 44476 = CIP 104973]
MKITNVSTALAAAAVAAAAILAGSPIAAADDSGVTTAALGSQAKLDNNNVVQGWTVTGLKPSTDTIAYDVKGTLWEITATSEALEGSVTPIVSNFNIRSADGHNYRALFQVPTEQGVNPATIAQGEKTTGKVYFDVTGDKPTTVVYNSGGRDLLVWDAPAPAPVPVSSGQQTHTAPVAQPAVATPAPAAVPATPAPAA